MALGSESMEVLAARVDLVAEGGGLAACREDQSRSGADWGKAAAGVQREVGSRADRSSLGSDEHNRLAPVVHMPSRQGDKDISIKKKVLNV